MANIPRSAEPSQGDVKFIDPPDSLQCPVCLSTLKQPHLLSCCGSHMCEVSYNATNRLYENAL